MNTAPASHVPVGLLESFERQAGWCADGGHAPFMAALMLASRDWLAEDEAARSHFESLATDALAAAVPLRWAGALHHLALRGIEPFAALWPPRGDDAAPDLGPAVRRAWTAHHDEVARALARLRAAQQAASVWMRESGVAIEALPASGFVARELGGAGPATPGQARVLMHSVVWQYIAGSEQQAITAAVHAAASRATQAAPLAWLRFEPGGAPLDFELRCTLWPGGEDLLLARAHPHGAWVEWLARSDAPA